jgi:hypothetical protein
MGLYYETCFITNLPISDDSDIVAFDEELLGKLTKRDLSWTDMPCFTFLRDMPPIDIHYGAMALLRGKLDSPYGECGDKKVWIACYKKSWEHLLSIKMNRTKKEVDKEILEFIEYSPKKEELLEHYKNNKKDYYEIYHVFHVLRFTLRRSPFDSIVTKGQQNSDMKTQVDFLEMCVQIPKTTDLKLKC